MKIAAIAAALVSAGAAYYLSIFVGGIAGVIVAILFGSFIPYILALAFWRPNNRQTVAHLNGLAWTVEDFCRGWLITGDTGSGKTRSGITPLLFQVFKHAKKWGGLCIDDKGLYWETLSEMAKHFRRENDLILLQVRPDLAPDDWLPPQTYNLVSDLAIPYTTYAKAIVDTATSMGQTGGNSFFRQQAQTHIGCALEALDRIGEIPSLDKVHRLLLDTKQIERALVELASCSDPINLRLTAHFRDRYLNQPPEQAGGVRETIANYLQPFMAAPITEVFCSDENTFELADVDKGKIICVSMPQKYQLERRYIATFLKLLFYTHVLKRFDKPKEARKGDNLLILWADEAQRFVSAAEDGMSDYNCVDVIREAKGTIVAAAQSSTSFIPPLGREKAHVFTLNLRNRMIFRAADEEGAKESADFIGSKTVIKRTWGYSGGKGSTNYAEQEEHRCKPSSLRSLKKHQCVLVHCEKGFKKTIIPPIEPDGTVCSWYRKP